MGILALFPHLSCRIIVKDLKYADSHEWVKIDGNSAIVGITDHAQDHLGDVVYVELPEAGAAVTEGSSFGAVESVKATSDINSPVSGKVVEVNEELNSSPVFKSERWPFLFFYFLLVFFSKFNFPNYDDRTIEPISNSKKSHLLGISSFCFRLH
ncbi:hypothetical protein PVL29_000174 [Vitis rotundifolia]|uniref:Glycine cleavage system H protein n=1 Tax=Vitis rotundifolia TaxID=103349 RepID=A0AA39E3A9_VITRO|nr:hypothetical protein PVL29_000174 [Vitis rotundifolia]